MNVPDYIGISAVHGGQNNDHPLVTSLGDTMPKQAIVSPTLPPPAGPYSPAIQYENLVFVSGQLGRDMSTGKLAEGIEAQTEHALRNIKTILAACNRSLDDALRVGVYLTDMSQFARMNAVYEKYFSKPYPARTTIGVAALPGGALVEIDMWAQTR
jgi:2-iminobutanoate/2-iminopropanoate deaminase